jgi:hypothetical protein
VVGPFLVGRMLTMVELKRVRSRPDEKPPLA